MRGAFETNKEKGFLGTPLDTHFALLHSEITEAFEAYRNGEPVFHVVNGKPEGMLSEFADEVIRIASLCQEYDLDLEGAIREKMIYNNSRPFKHGGKKF
jgi:NTP pyrophosphatase (non-canonical NTP hydrolase)